MMARDESNLPLNEESYYHLREKADGSVISTLKGEKDSYYVSIEEMPVDAVTAIVSIEDKKFFRHHGIDYRALLRAVKAMVQNPP